MVELLPATQDLVERYYGKRPLMSMRGVVAVEDGVPIGLGGVYRDQNRMVVFCEMKPAAKKYRKHILMAARLVLKLAYEYDELRAVASPDEPTAVRFLGHLGFRHEVADVYVIRREWLCK